ncbi:inorganic pyrophosphatase [Putridiphycobacter roseus]|uniref:inorganic diphosphatase n=2 Tax=Putridiphycobacter roseus TaxID=2219161 RepID=A0A2W1N3I4_9FLAO|nr:inorganic pyrophosphatase [Putridiphycobacter roseus]
MMTKLNKLIQLFEQKFVAHPWHGVTLGENAPNEVKAYIEINPTDQIKYEIDKPSGHIFIDRPQKYSNIVPALYGFLPQTYCDTLVADYCMEKSGKTGIVGDADPLDIIVISERNIDRGDILVNCIPVGGFRMIDGGEADDKIIAVLKDDQAYGKMKNIDEIPSLVLDRIKHFFLTYKSNPNADGSDKKVEITDTYGKEEALKVINLSHQDYLNKYGNVNTDFADTLKALLG